MSKNMSQEDQLFQVYRQYQQSHNTGSQVVEYLYNEVLKLRQINENLQKQVVKPDKK